LKDKATRPKLWIGICSAGIYSTAPSSIIRAGPGPLLIGPTEEPGNQHLHIANLLYEPRNYLLISITTSSEIKTAQLLKFVVDGIINPLTAIFTGKNKEVLNERPRKTLVKILIREIGLIVRRLGPLESRSTVDDLDLKGKVLLFEDESLMRRIVSR